MPRPIGQTGTLLALNLDTNPVTLNHVTKRNQSLRYKPRPVHPRHSQAIPPPQAPSTYAGEIIRILRWSRRTATIPRKINGLE